MSWINNQSFRNRILLGCLLVALIPLAVSSIITLRFYDITFHNQNRNEGAVQMEGVNSQLTELFAACEEALDDLADSTLIAEMLVEPDEELVDNVYLEFYQATDGLRGTSSFFLYDARGILRYTTETGPTRISLPVQWGLLPKAVNREGAVYYAMEEGETSTQPVLMKGARVIRDPSGEVAGYAVVNLTEGTIAQIFSRVTARNSVLLLDEFWAPVYARPAGETEARLQGLRQIFSATGTLPSAETEGGFSYQLLQNPPSGYYILMEQTSIISGGVRATMQSISLAAGLTSLFLCIWVSALLSKSLARPVRELNDGMAKVREGDLDTRVEPRQNDELGELAESFNTMTQDLKKHLESLVGRQKELNDAQIRLLQAQLNPHFLYNTLDTMKWLAKINKVPEIAAIASSLAYILRRSIASEQFVTLRQEAEMIERYIDIQKIRFSGRFHYVLELPKELESCMIPKLILQPLVENAIIHGLEDSEDGYLYIYASRREETLRISITDDGSGMPLETVERLNSGEPKILEGHLGLYNVGSIISRYYGPEYGLRANAIPGIGTTVVVTLPVRKEEENAQSGDY